MAKKKRIDLKLIVAEALEYYHNYVKKTIKESTKRQNESLLSEFYRFVDTLPARDKTMKIFSQKGLNRYKEYLIDKMERSKTDGRKRNFGVGQLNRCGAIIALLINRVLVDKEDGIVRVIWNKVDDPRREDQKGHFPLLDNEVTAIENCSGLTPVEEEYRNIFLLQIECGQRVSDLAKILTGKYRVKQGKRFKYIIISTIKENIKAHIPLRPKMRMWMEKVNSHKLITSVKFEKRVNSKGNGTYNQAIRRIVKKAGLDREIVRIDSILLEVRGPLYEEITNHAARCTFITNMLKKGVSTERLSKMTGHASDEMIKRVYAQLTEDDEINLIESDLYNDIDDDVASIPADSSPDNSDEHKTDVPLESLPGIYTPNDFDPKTIFESKEYIAHEKYIQGLNNLVDEAINELNSYQIYTDYIEVFCQSVLNKLIELIEQSKQEIESGVKSKIQSQIIDPPKLSQIIESGYEKVVNNVWQIIESILEKEKIESDYLDNVKVYEIIRLCLLRAWIDYLRGHHFGEDLIESHEKGFKAICEENPSLFIAYRNMTHYKVVWPILKLWIVLLKMELFMQDNRPFADNSMIKEYSRMNKFPTNWRFVFKELQRTPAMKLGTLIQNTECEYAMKSVFYNSIKEGDFESFYETIKEHSHEARLLINYSYSNQYSRTFVQTVDHLFQESINGVEMPFEMINRCTEVLLQMNPFFDGGHEESTPNFLKKDIQEIDIKELYLWLLDDCIKTFDESNSFYPSERKVYNKVFSLVDFNKHPELKKAYDEYKAKQKSVTNQKEIEAKIVSEEDKVENRKKASSKVNYLPVSIQNLDIDKFIRLLTEKDELNNNKQFITVLESTDNVNVATCLMHFLYTRSPSPLSFTLKWNGNSMVSLKFLIRLIVNTNKDATRDNVIEKKSKKAFDGISKNVSKWKGSGDLWTPVYNVFEGCTSSILTAALGEEGTDAKTINLNELETIADIYFDCKL